MALRDSRFIALTRESGRIEECQATVRNQCRQTIQGLCKETTRRRFYRDVTNDPFHAQDLIEELRLLGAEPEEVENLKTFLANQSQKPATPTIAAIPPLTIFWVGGDETQEDYDEYIKAKIQDAYPSVTLEIHHTGWTSNWGRKLDDFHDRFIQSNALVLMTMIRTNLARTLRCLAGNHDIPWISCTGRGRSSSLRAIEEAINVATRQHERGGGQSECEATQ